MHFLFLIFDCRFQMTEKDSKDKNIIAWNMKFLIAGSVI